MRLLMDTALTEYNVQPGSEAVEHVFLIDNVVGPDLLVEVLSSPASVPGHPAFPRNVFGNLQPNTSIQEVYHTFVMEGFEPFEDNAINGFICNLLLQDFQNTIVIQALWLVPWHMLAVRKDPFEKRILTNDADPTIMSINEKARDAVAFSFLGFVHAPA